ncbi:unnamed protein product [Nesidiocoris tenuis]|uniref:Uncharacterized protein n=1 Tax=Nesidiocoris tenuis TaxID=355587 RepID=A0A6H5H4J5_9HEMI|nr:unnamed protein product [Nesidiocoris tenuis]
MRKRSRRRRFGRRRCRRRSREELHPTNFWTPSIPSNTEQLRATAALRNIHGKEKSPRGPRQVEGANPSGAQAVPLPPPIAASNRTIYIERPIRCRRLERKPHERHSPYAGPTIRTLYSFTAVEKGVIEIQNKNFSEAIDFESLRHETSSTAMRIAGYVKFSGLGARPLYRTAAPLPPRRAPTSAEWAATDPPAASAVSPLCICPPLFCRCGSLLSTPTTTSSSFMKFILNFVNLTRANFPAADGGKIDLAT